MFVLKCETCGLLYFIRRPRRVLGWLPLPEGHGPGRPCQGSFRVLHHGDRRAALQAAELLRNAVKTERRAALRAGGRG